MRKIALLFLICCGVGSTWTCLAETQNKTMNDCVYERFCRYSAQDNKTVCYLAWNEKLNTCIENFALYSRSNKKVQHYSSRQAIRQRILAIHILTQQLHALHFTRKRDKLRKATLLQSFNNELEHLISQLHANR